MFSSRTCPRLRAVLFAVTTAALLLCAPVQGQAPACPNADQSFANGASQAVMRHAVVCLINRERTQRGLAPLAAQRNLTAAAKRHARYLVKKRKYHHGNVTKRLVKFGYARGMRKWRVGENRLSRPPAGARTASRIKRGPPGLHQPAVKPVVVAQLSSR